jgi:hypothetical protein
MSFAAVSRISRSAPLMLLLCETEAAAATQEVNKKVIFVSLLN